MRATPWQSVGGMRVIAVFFGPCAPDVLTAHGSVFSHDFKRLDRFTKLATSSVSRHENRNLTGSWGKMQQRSVDLRLQVGELRKILQMRRFLLDLLPQVFDRVEIRRVGWQ